MSCPAIVPTGEADEGAGAAHGTGLVTEAAGPGVQPATAKASNPIDTAWVVNCARSTSQLKRRKSVARYEFAPNFATAKPV